MPSKVSIQKVIYLPTEIIQNIVNYIQTSAVNFGKSAYSVGVRSIVETRDNLLLFCIALLEALDYLQERLHLPISVVKKAKLKLKQIVETSSSKAPVLQNAKVLGKTIADSDVWMESKAEDVQSFTMWVISLVTWLNSIIASSTSQIYNKLLVVIADIPGTLRTNVYLQRLHQILDSVISTTSESGDPNYQTALGYVDSLGDRNLTAVVVSYHEKEDVVPWCINRRIHRMMHYRVSLRPFEATIRLPQEGEGVSSGEETSTANCNKTSLISTPQSFPASPDARSRVLADFSNFADDVLYRVRDELRYERAASITGQPRGPFATFDPNDAHPDIFLSCGYHCAAKIGSGVYRTVRASLPISRGRYVYFEMSISRFCNIEKDVASSVGNTTTSSLAIGLSTKEMPLNTLVGTWTHSIGLYSSGHIITGSQWHKHVAIDISYGCGNTIGVLTHISDKANDEDDHPVTASVQFMIDGKPLHDGANKIPSTLVTLPGNAQVFPTLTLYSADTQVLCRFCSADIVCSYEKLDVESDSEVWCVDGSRLRK